jgi:hypothetical protein
MVVDVAERSAVVEWFVIRWRELGGPWQEDALRSHLAAAARQAELQRRGYETQYVMENEKGEQYPYDHQQH